MAMISQFPNMTPLLKFFNVVLFLLSSLVTGPSSMSSFRTIYFYKGLTNNLEIGNNPVWGLPNIWRLGWVSNTKFGTNVSNKILLNAAKHQGCSFYRFWVIKWKPIEARGVEGKTKPPPRLGLSYYLRRVWYIKFHVFSRTPTFTTSEKV